jgi:hypothetical protein
MPLMTIMPTHRRTRDARALFLDRREIISLLFLLAVYALAAMSQADELIVAVNVTGSCTLIFVMLYRCHRDLEQTPLAIWTPLVWFRLACAVYFGLGQLVPYIANDATLGSMLEVYYFSNAEILKLNAISELGIVCVLAGASVIRTVPRTTRGVRAQSAGRSLSLALVFTIFGGILRYGLVVPIGLGYLEIIPGVVLTLAKLYSAGLLLLLLAGLRQGGAALIAAIGLISLDLFISTLLFSKIEVLATILLVLLAVWHHSPGYKKLAIVSLAAIATYVALVPLVLYGRYQIIEQYGSPTAAVPLEERFAIVGDYFSGGQAQWEEITGGEQTSLMRLSYVNVAARVVAWQEHGSPGDSLRDALTVLVPRIVWPDKPEI